MADVIERIAHDFLNIRGTFRIGGVLDIGTQCSLVRRAGGGYVFLDSYTLGPEIRREIDLITDGGRQVESILNLHPFHTVHVQAMHRQFPAAKLYGTARHLALFPHLPWQKTRTEQPRMQRIFARDLAFSVPRGLDFVSPNGNVHCSSVLAFHRASRTIHVDDTLMFLNLSWPLRLAGCRDLLLFHPALWLALEKRAGAGPAFRAWAEALADDWRDARNLCAAHSAVLREERNPGDGIRDRILAAVERVSFLLR